MVRLRNMQEMEAGEEEEVKTTKCFLFLSVEMKHLKRDGTYAILQAFYWNAMRFLCRRLWFGLESQICWLESWHNNKKKTVDLDFDSTDSWLHSSLLTQEPKIKHRTSMRTFLESYLCVLSSNDVVYLECCKYKFTDMHNLRISTIQIIFALNSH